MADSEKPTSRLELFINALRRILFGEFFEIRPLGRTLRRKDRYAAQKKMSKFMLQKEVEKWSRRAEAARQLGDEELLEQALAHRRLCEQDLAEIDDFETIAENET